MSNLNEISKKRGSEWMANTLLEANKHHKLDQLETYFIQSNDQVEIDNKLRELAENNRKLDRLIRIKNRQAKFKERRERLITFVSQINDEIVEDDLVREGYWGYKHSKVDKNLYIGRLLRSLSYDHLICQLH